jgi:glyoxylase-like metal-dependent hydrolase (beta-lactamase superfamily II)
MNDVIMPLADDIYFLRGKNDAKYPYSHSLLVGNFLIDTGISREHLKLLKTNNFSIDTIILSHWHEDHIRDALFLKANHYLSHPKDKPMIENFSGLFKKYTGITEEDFQKFGDFILSYLKTLRIKNIKIDRVIIDDEIIKINENCRLKVIHTPGHTAGHCSFIELNSGIVYLTDIDFKDFGPFYGAQDSSLTDFENSIEKVKKIDMDIAISAHKGIFKGRKLIREKLDEYKAIIDKRDEKILEFCSEKRPIQVENLVLKNIIYKTLHKIDFFKAHYIRYEKRMLEQHFERLVSRNIIEPKGNGFVLA